jgi:sarcosine/dimethylglycine N-methyltransferase
MTYTEANLIDTIEDLTGRALTALTRPQLDVLDQFHAGGAEAVDRLLPSLALAPSMNVLDVGSGLGGPARQIARATGCAVLGVDITRSYVDTATALTEAAGLAGQVHFMHGDAGSLDQDHFDAAYCIHVQMNVADKKAFFTDIANRLRAGGRLGIFEVCRTGLDDPALPLPWSMDGSDSHLSNPDDLLATIQDCGFEISEWVDDTEWTLEWFHQLGVRMEAAQSAATLPALLTDGPTRMLNFVTAVSNGTLTVHRGAFVLGGDEVGPRAEARS